MTQACHRAAAADGEVGARDALIRDVGVLETLALLLAVSLIVSGCLF